MRDKPHDKMGRPTRDKATDDFTEIPGVPAFVSESLHNQGVLRFDQLWEADVRWLHGPVRTAIERWRGG